MPKIEIETTGQVEQWVEEYCERRGVEVRDFWNTALHFIAGWLMAGAGDLTSYLEREVRPNGPLEIEEGAILQIEGLRYKVAYVSETNVIGSLRLWLDKEAD